MRRSSSASSKPLACLRSASSRSSAALGRLGRLEQEAVRLVGAAPDPPAQLVQLGEAEAVGVLDDDRRRVRDVDADLDHRRRDQHLRLARREGPHRRGLLGGREPAVHEPDPQRLELAHEMLVLVLGGARLHASRSPRRASRSRRPGGRARSTGASASGSSRRACRRARDAVLIGRRPGGMSRSSETSRSPYSAERERARDRRRGHVQRVRPVRLRQAGALLDAEAMLLVDHGDEQAVELDARSSSACVPTAIDASPEASRCSRTRRSRRRDLAGDQLDREAERLEQRRAAWPRAAGRASRSAPSARPARRPRRRARARAPRRPSCPSRRRRAAAGASGARGAGRARARGSRGAARRSARTAGSRGSGARARPAPAAAAPAPRDRARGGAGSAPAAAAAAPRRRAAGARCAARPPSGARASPPGRRVATAARARRAGRRAAARAPRRGGAGARRRCPCRSREGRVLVAS